MNCAAAILAVKQKERKLEHTSANDRRSLKRIDRLLYSVDVVFLSVTSTTLASLEPALNLSKAACVEGR